MNKIYPVILIATLLSLAPSSPLRANNTEVPEAMETAVAAPEIGLTVNGQNVRITHAQGKTLEVYSVTGVKVATVSIDANDKTVNLSLSRGWYILKVGNVTRKISVK